MREYKKVGPIKEIKKAKVKELGVCQENLVSKKAKGRKYFKKEVFYNKSC